MDERVDRPAAEHPPLSRVPVRRSGLRWLVWLIVLVVIALGAAGFWNHQMASTARRGAGGHDAQTPPQPVGAATIGTGDIRIILNELGTVTSLDTVTVATQINGQLTQVGFQEGQQVKQGDFLAQIDPRPYQVALEQAEGFKRERGTQKPEPASLGVRLQELPLLLGEFVAAPVFEPALILG